MDCSWWFCHSWYTWGLQNFIFGAWAVYGTNDWDRYFHRWQEPFMQVLNNTPIGGADGNTWTLITTSIQLGNTLGVILSNDPDPSTFE